MKKCVQKMSVASLLVLVLSACGGSNGGNTVPSTISGHFIDDPVQGLSYSCSSGLSGKTNSNGEYICNIGDNVTFTIGSTQIGTVAAQTMAITPYTMFPNNKSAAINLARLLQSLNTNSQSSRIDINTTLEDILPKDLNFTNASFETASETALGFTLVNALSAQTKMNIAISKAGGTIPSEINHLPIANAGVDQTVELNTTVSLDGHLSSDSDMDNLTYQWTLTSFPSESNSTIYFENNNSTIAKPAVRLPVVGSYIFSLVVNDGTVNSLVDTVTITVTPYGAITHKNIVYGTVISPYTGRVWLDRNLGASQVCTAYNDSKCYGDFYQWGRNIDGHEKPTSAVTTTLASNINFVGTNFIKHVSSPRDWSTTDISGDLRHENWSKTDGSSICPVGFRVPTINEIKAETIEVGEYSSVVVSDRIDAFDSFLKLPSSGDRKGSTGLRSWKGIYGFIWSSTNTASSSKSYVFNYLSSSVQATNTYRSNGHPVRCIKD